MSTIDWLLRKHNSDKEVFHGYGHLYEEYFNPLKDEEITLFEIGVQGGHSMKAWVDYFENGKIVKEGTFDELMSIPNFKKLSEVS